MNEPQARIVKRLRQGGNVLIASHVNPDGDSVGSQLALASLVTQLGGEPWLISEDPVLPKYGFLPLAHQVRLYRPEDTYPPFTTALVLEAPEPARIGEVKNLIDDHCFVINIDHHPDHESWGRLNYIDESVAAAGILVYRLFETAGARLSAEDADALFTAILTDTGRFRFSNTNAEAMQICAKLLECGASPKRVSDALYASFDQRQLRLLGELIAGMELLADGRICLLLLNSALRQRYGNGADEIEGLADYSLYPSGVRVGAVLRELEPNVTKVSLRSHDKYDVSAVARRYGGGGHRNAAGCYIRQSFNQAREALLEQLLEVVAR